MNEDHIILGMVDGVGDLRGGQTDIHRMQHRPQHGHRKETFEIAMRVPVHHRNDITLPDTMLGKATCQCFQARIKVAIAVAHQTGTDDFGLRRILQRRTQQRFDQQWKIGR